MFGLSGTELIIIAVVALLVLGPKKLPELARTVGKGLREFRKATEGVRQTVESEFYKMDQEASVQLPPLDAPAVKLPPAAGPNVTPQPAPGAKAANAPAAADTVGAAPPAGGVPPAGSAKT